MLSIERAFDTEQQGIDMNLHLAGKVAIVTGSSAGMGRATAALLAAEGCAVLVCGRDATRLADVADELRSLEGDVATADMDLRDAGSAQRIVEQAMEWKGRLDVLVTAARSSPPRAASGIDEVLARLHGKVELTMRCARAAIPAMTASGGGSIVCLGGTSANTPLSQFNQDALLVQEQSSLAQGMSNAAIANFTKHLSDEVGGAGIRVNTVHPGIVAQTEQHAQTIGVLVHEQDMDLSEVDSLFTRRSPLGRVVEPREVAAMITFLCSPVSSGITGESISVDAGMKRAVSY